MNQNVLNNSSWIQMGEQVPVSYSTLGKIHFDTCQIKGARLASLQIISNEGERLSYIPLISVKGFESLMMGLIIRGNDVHEFCYQVVFYDQKKQQIKKIKHNVATEITPQFKTIRVTYKVPIQAEFTSISWEVTGRATGVTLYRPSIQLI